MAAVSDRIRTYIASGFPSISQDLSLFLSNEFQKIVASLRTMQQVIQALDTTKTLLVNAANDVAAATAGVPIQGLYHNGGAVRVRLT